MNNNRMTVTVEEAAEILGISRAFAYILVKREELPCVRLGRRVVVPRRALDRLLDAKPEFDGDDVAIDGHGSEGT